MMSHQKYFPVIDTKGDLMPYFITINNTLARDPSIVARGNEKVIRARLSDARFFFREDQKISLDKRVEDLQKVVFHSQLGTSYEKVQRFRRLAAHIAHQLNPALVATVDRAATLAKADLDTQMVGEFSELQGVMGGSMPSSPEKILLLPRLSTNIICPQLPAENCPRQKKAPSSVLPTKWIRSPVSSVSISYPQARPIPMPSGGRHWVSSILSWIKIIPCLWRA